MWISAIGLRKLELDSNRNEACNDEAVMTVYYSVLAAAGNFCGAIVKISHLAMIPEITSIENERGVLNTIRNVVTAVSNVFVYGSLWFMLTSGTILVWF